MDIRGKRIFKPDEGVVVASFAEDVGPLCAAGFACLEAAALFEADVFVSDSTGETVDLYRSDGCRDVGAGTLRIGVRVWVFPLGCAGAGTTVAGESALRAGCLFRLARDAGTDAAGSAAATPDVESECSGVVAEIEDGGNVSTSGGDDEAWVVGGSDGAREDVARWPWWW